MHQIIIDLPFDIDDRFEIEQDDNIEEKMDEIKKYIIKQKALKEIRALKGVLKGIDVSEEEMYMQGDWAADIFVDSSVIIEYFKTTETAVSLLESLLSKNIDLKVNHIVMSEVIYQLKFRRDIDIAMIKNFILAFDVLDMNNAIFDKAIWIIEKYNLKPNDALIVATCLDNKIDKLATFDKDFIVIENNFNISIVDSDEMIKECN